jgi:hypothetical protein
MASDTNALEQLVCSRVAIAAQERWVRKGLAQLSISPTVVVERRAEDLLLKIEAFALGRHIERISIHHKWPADWWQAFRERWFPKWWLQRHPVRYSRVDVDRQVTFICPHLGVADPEHHMQFLKRDMTFLKRADSTPEGRRP